MRDKEGMRALLGVFVLPKHAKIRVYCDYRALAVARRSSVHCMVIATKDTGSGSRKGQLGNTRLPSDSSSTYVTASERA
jgi:hypothetical protein